MKKRPLSTLLVLCMVLTMLPVTVHAAEISGSCGDNVTWSYSDGTLNIEGEGQMEDYDIYNGLFPEWKDYNDQINTIMWLSL